MISFLYVSAVLVAFTSGVNSAKFPDNWELCPKTGNEECLKKAVQDAIISLKDGNKKLSIFPLDPLRIQRMEIAQGGGPVSINLTFYDVDMMGFGDISVTSAKADWDNYKIDFDFDFNGLGSVLGDYSVEGKILVLPIQGNGKANITFTGVNVNLRLQGSEVVRGGEKYMKIDEAKFYLNPARVYTHLSNLFNGVPNLGENMNKFLNENWKVILDEMKETVASAMGQAVTQIANVFFKNIPINQLYKS